MEILRSSKLGRISVLAFLLTLIVNFQNCAPGFGTAKLGSEADGFSDSQSSGAVAL
jgi:hypothetical protein